MESNAAMSDASTLTNAAAIPDHALFQVKDYVIFGVILLIPSIIGIFFAIRNRRKSSLTTETYFMANRKMSYGPISFSLIASITSSLTILRIPAEYYVYGAMYTWSVLVYALLPILIGWVYVPVFYELGASSIYEYLEKRFNKPTRLVTAFMFLIYSIIYGAMVVYIPANVLREVTGFDMWIAILTSGFVCIFYTSLGGLKAVIWTDVFQFFVMMGVYIAVIIQGSINFHGFFNILQAAGDGGRLDYNHFEFDPRIRHTFWSVVFGGSVLWLGVNGVNQVQVQRYMSCKSKRDVQISILWNAFGSIIVLVLASLTGLTIFATYSKCDPLDNEEITNSDQLFPYMVMNNLFHLPGLPGVFVAAIFCGTLSTISSCMNSMACVTVEDFVKPYTRWRTKSYTLLSKYLVIGYGIIFILFAYLASKVDGVTQISFSIHGIINGPIVGLFTLGIMLPFVNSWGALCGVTLGWATTIWMFIGSLFYPVPPEFERALHRSVNGCKNTNSSTVEYTSTSAHFYSSISYQTLSSNSTSSTGFEIKNDERPAIADFYNLSYLYLAGVGCLVTLLIGILISLFTGLTRKLPPSNELLCSIFHSKRDDGKPPLERSTSWFSPTEIANAQRIIREDSDMSFKPVSEFEPLQRSPDVISSMVGETFIPEKESSF